LIFFPLKSTNHSIVSCYIFSRIFLYAKDENLAINIVNFDIMAISHSWFIIYSHHLTLWQCLNSVKRFNCWSTVNFITLLTVGSFATFKAAPLKWAFELSQVIFLCKWCTKSPFLTRNWRESRLFISLWAGIYAAKQFCKLSRLSQFFLCQTLP